MNKVILIGRLCNDVETRYTNSGNAVSSYRIAVDRQKTKDGQQEADFLSCVAFGKGAEFAQKYLSKGMKIAIEGRIQTGSYEKDGVKHYTTDIIVDRHEFCDSKKDEPSDRPYVGGGRKANDAEMAGYQQPFPLLTGDDSELPF